MYISNLINNLNDKDFDEHFWEILDQVHAELFIINNCEIIYA